MQQPIEYLCSAAVLFGDLRSRHQRIRIAQLRFVAAPARRLLMQQAKQHIPVKRLRTIRYTDCRVVQLAELLCHVLRDAVVFYIPLDRAPALILQPDTGHILFIKSDLRLVVDLQNCIKAQQSRAYAQKVKISNLQQMAKTVAYIQEHGYDTQKKLQDTTDTIQSKMAKARSDAKLTEAKLKKVNEQIHYLGQYLSTKSVYADFLKSTNKKDFRQNHADEIAKYEEALQFLKQNSPDGKLPTMKDLRSEKELLVQQKSAQYETHQYFRDYHRELQTVCENVNHILDASQTKQQEQKKSHQSEHSI